MNNNFLLRCTAMTLSIIIILMLVPGSVLAEADTSFISGSAEIIAINELSHEITSQHVPVGTDESSLNMPTILTIIANLNCDPEELELESGEADGLSPIELGLAITWQSTPAYDGNTSGEYVFTPQLLEHYTLVEGLKLPQITVTVEEIMFSVMSDVSADYSWYDVNKAASQFTINSSAQLKGLADIVNGDHGAAFGFYGKVIELTADLDLSEYTNWTPIGFNNKSFDGTFNGNSKTINGLTIDASGQSYVGLFGLMTGSVSNLYLSNVNIIGGQNVGGIAGETWGSISHCAVLSGTITGNSYFGGIAGKVIYNTSSLSGCFTACNVRATSFSPYSAGGIAGRVESGGKVTDCYATGSVKPGADVSGYFEGAGGVTGSVNGGRVQGCFATGEVAGTISIGGVTGVLSDGYGSTSLTNCAALNIRVAGDSSAYGGPSTGRIIGRVSGGPQVTNVIAFSGMIVVTGGGNNLNGTDKSSTEIKAAGFFETNGFLSPNWQNGIGMLPILTGFPEGLQSTELPAHIGSPTPTQPQALKAEPNNGSVKLDWVIPGSVGASSITRYEVRKNNDSWISVGMAMSYIFNGLSNGSLYTFEVRAVNSYGNGASTSIKRIPVSPGNMAVIPGDQSVILNWATPSSLIEKIQLYQVRYNEGAWRLADANYVHTFVGLVNGDNYTFEMQAVGKDGSFVGVLFNASAQAMPIGKPLMPTNLVAVPGNGQIQLSWDAPYSNGGSPIIRYEVSQNDGGWVSVGTSTSYTFTSLNNATVYALQVRAVNAIGESSAQTISATPRHPPLITSVNNHNFTYGSGGIFTVSSSGTPPITYTLSGQPAGVSINSITGDVTIAKTVAADTYTFTVTATNGAPPDATQNIILDIKPFTPQLSDIHYTIPSDHTYNGSGIGIGPVTDKNTIGLSCTVYYQGIDETIYPKSATPPKNVGKYEVIVEIIASTNINGAELLIGSYRILPKNITITPASGQNKVYGQSDPPLQYTLSDVLFAGDGLNGTLIRNAGENVGTYNITMGTLTAGNNYTLLLSGTANFIIKPKADTVFTIAAIAPQSYTGSAITPEPQVRDGSTVLIKNVDFTYSYSNNTNVGTTATISIYGKGNYAGSTGSTTFIINPKADALFYIAAIAPQTYSGNTITPEPQVRDGSTVLKKNVDFTYSYNNNTDVGTSATININGIGNYAGSTGSTTFIINPKADAVFTIIGIAPQIYSGNTITPEPQVRDGSTILTENVDFTYSYSNNINAGTTASVSINGIGNYAGSTGSTTFIINPKADAIFTIAGIAPQTYSGSAITPEPQVRDGSTVLTMNVDFTFSYINNIDTGTSAVINIIGIGNYAGSTGSATFIINPKADAVFIIDEVAPQIYSGSTINPEPQVKDGSMILTKNVDYTYSYNNNINAGTTASIVINGIGNYAGSTGSTTFNINKAIPSMILTADPEITQMRPGSITLSATLPGDALGSLTFKVGADIIGESITLPDKTIVFTPTTENNNYSFTVEYSGDSNYEGVSSLTLEYNFTKSDQMELDIADGIISYGDTLNLNTLVSGGSGTGAISFIVTDGPAILDRTTLNPSGVGEVSILATKEADNDYNSKSATFIIKINPRVITFSIAPVELQTYTGNAITPTPEVRDGNMVLVEGVHFNYNYNDNMDAGTSAVVSLTGIGNYTGSTGYVYFTIGGATPNIITPPIINSTVYAETALSQIALEDGEASVLGHFEWVNQSAYTVLGLNTFEARFVPDDTVIYTTVEDIIISFNAIKPTGGSSSTKTYRADVLLLNGSKTIRKVNVNNSNRTASVDLGSQFNIQEGTIVTLPSIPGVNTYSIGIQVSKLSISGVQGTLTFNSSIGNIIIPSNMLKGVSDINGSKAEISISKGDTSSLPNNVKSAIGAKPFIRLILSIDGKKTNWSNSEAPVMVSVPYTPTAEEIKNPESIIIWYIDGDGNVVTIPNGHYNPTTGMVSFYTTHFSDYAVAYNKVSFRDVAVNAWYNKAICFIAARGITSGTGNGCFNPNANLTRGEFIVLMMKAYGIVPDTNFDENFADAGNTYYTSYLATAKRLGITEGVGNNMYEPHNEITRQEMFTMLYNALRVIEKLPQSISDKTVFDFSDESHISEWAREAMTCFVMTGTISGSDGMLTPNGTTTRAEMAQVLFNLLGK